MYTRRFARPERFSTIYNDVRKKLNPVTGKNKIKQLHISAMVNTILRRR